MPARKLIVEECTAESSVSILAKHVGWLDELAVLSFEHFGNLMEIVMAK